LLSATLDGRMSAIPTIALQRFRLLIQQVPGFAPPPAVANLKDEVDLDLVLGMQMLWTAAAIQGPISYGRLSDWIALTLPNKSPHRFLGSSIGEDTEVSGSFSTDFSKLVGLAFMGQYADAAWFKTLRPLWDDTLATQAGAIKIVKKDTDANGPDYLAAPFDPTAKQFGGPFYAVEFKGKKAKVELDSATFRGWSKQAGNISLTLAPAQTPVSIKAWVLGFNYGFEKAEASREESALLVEDPETAPGEKPLEPERSNGSSIIRDHLARQCALLGAPVLAPFIRLGAPLDGAAGLPAVYKIDHARLKDRRYIGAWYVAAPTGELLPAPSPWPGPGWTVIERGPDWFVYRRGPDVAEVYVRAHGPVWGLHALLAGGAGHVFVGQDATMLRRCTQVRIGAALDGEPFQDEIHFAQVIGEGPYAEPLRVLRNGSVIAPSAVVQLDDESFWT
jgi:hypothetical protein